MYLIVAIFAFKTNGESSTGWSSTCLISFMQFFGRHQISIPGKKKQRIVFLFHATEPRSGKFLLGMELGKWGLSAVSSVVQFSALRCLGPALQACCYGCIDLISLPMIN